MTDSEHKRRLTQNEAVFRKWNETIYDAAIDESTVAAQDADQLAHFLCECSDEDCGEVLEISYGDYEAIHKQRHSFVVKKHHEAGEVEDIVAQELNYSVVRKKDQPPEDPDELLETIISNT